MHEIPAALGAIQILKNLAKSAIDVRQTSALREQAIESQAAIIELQTTLLNMQSQYQSLLQEKDTLKKQLADIEDWSTEAAKYELKDLGRGVLVYAQRPEYNALTPAHWVCTRCYQDRQKSVLIYTGRYIPSGNRFSCFRCNNHIHTDNAIPGAATSYRRKLGMKE